MSVVMTELINTLDFLTCCCFEGINLTCLAEQVWQRGPFLSLTSVKTYTLDDNLGY